jgi:hypothetical protein
MHYNIDYTDLQEPAKSQKALEDIQNYLGGKREFNNMVRKIKGHPKKDIVMALSMFVGIEGYPAHVLADKYGKGELK